MRLRTERRSHWIIVASCLLAVGLTTAAAVADSPPVKGAAAAHSGPASASGTAKPKSSTAAHTLYFGLAYGDTLISDSSAALSASLNEAVSLGASYIRVDLPWSSVQPNSPQDYEWGAFDHIVLAANSRGLKIDATLDDVPPWARKSSCAAYFPCPPQDDAAFAAFAGMAAKRYAPLGVNTWEIWNEPNMGAWWTPSPNPAAYEQLLTVTAAALRKAEPGAFIILGGLAAVTTSAAHKWESATSFLAAVAKLGGTRSVNAVGFHPYSLPQMPGQSSAYAQISTTLQGNLLGVLQQYGTPNVQIWLTETGAPVTQAATDPGAKKAATKQAEDIQAEYAVDLVQTVAANPHVSAAFWYSDQDDPQANTYFGLRRTNGTYRPAFQALKDSISACGCGKTGN